MLTPFKNLIPSPEQSNLPDYTSFGIYLSSPTPPLSQLSPKTGYQLNKSPTCGKCSYGKWSILSGFCYVSAVYSWQKRYRQNEFLHQVDYS
jgi:hypothetical protein